ncbi:MAG: hypothetical protein OEZ07_02105 [Dehalococcoidia bacterium]|nr:hypothetical protein [Dehalococcoidia bacterium]
MSYVAVFHLIYKGDKLCQISLTTMWAKGRFGNMVEFVTKAKELGFTRNFLREKGIAG